MKMIWRYLNMCFLIFVCFSGDNCWEDDEVDLGGFSFFFVGFHLYRQWSRMFADDLLKNLKVEMTRKTRKRNHTFELIHSDLERRKVITIIVITIIVLIKKREVGENVSIRSYNSQFWLGGSKSLTYICAWISKLSKHWYNSGTRA